jgi:uncharacterized protein YfeS/predicted DNA-binding WGR domain protein
MEKYLRFTDEKSDKYWEIVCKETKSTVFFGRIGSAGRVEEKSFATNEECIKEAEKQIASKIKKGYNETLISNRPIKDAKTLLNILEFEENWDVKASPISKKLMNEPFYWSCIEESSPFGSDEGSDTFSFLKEFYQENPGKKTLDFLLNIFNESTEVYPLKDLNCIDEVELKALNIDLYYVIIQDSAIWAAAFGQLVLKGKIDEELKNIAKNALTRQTLNVILDQHGDEERLKHIAKMQEVLNQV